MGLQLEGLAGLVEADVSVVAHAQDLDVDAAQAANDLIVPRALGGGVGREALGHIGSGRVDVDVVKEVGLHKIAVALGVVRREAHVLVQIHALDLVKVQIPLVIPVDELLIHAHWGGPGGQSQHAGGVQDHLGGDNIGRLAAHTLIVLSNINLHICGDLLLPYTDRGKHLPCW